MKGIETCHDSSGIWAEKEIIYDNKQCVATVHEIDIFCFSIYVKNDDEPYMPEDILLSCRYRDLPSHLKDLHVELVKAIGNESIRNYSELLTKL